MRADSSFRLGLPGPMQRDELHRQITKKSKRSGKCHLRTRSADPHIPDSEFRAFFGASAMERRSPQGAVIQRFAIPNDRAGFTRLPDDSKTLTANYLIDIARALPSCGAELVCLKRFFFMNLSRRYSSGAGVSATGLHHFGGLSEVST